MNVAGQASVAWLSASPYCVVSQNDWLSLGDHSQGVIVKVSVTRNTHASYYRVGLTGFLCLIHVPVWSFFHSVIQLLFFVFLHKHTLVHTHTHTHTRLHACIQACTHRSMLVNKEGKV